MRSFQQAVMLGILVALAGPSLAQGPGPENQGDKQDGEEQLIERRRAWFLESRGLARVEAPERTRAEAVAELAARRTPSGTVGARWEPLGPETATMFSWVMGRVSGRVTALAVDPTTESRLYLGTASGGLWKTEDSGTSWQQLFDAVGTQSIGSLFLESGNPQSLWVGTGDHGSWCGGYFGLGLFHSSDGGQTFTAKNGSGAGALELSYITALVVSPSNPQIVLAGGPRWCSGGVDFAGALYRSTDRGASWTEVLSGPVQDLLVDPTTPTTMYAAIGNWGFANDGIYRSVNSGASWARLTTGLPFGSGVGRLRLAMAPSAPQTLYALVNRPSTGTGLYKSTNGGNNWALQNGSACDGQCSYNLTLAVHPTTPETLVLGTIRPYKSTDSGVTRNVLTNSWGSTQQVHQDTHVVVYSRTNGNRFWVGSDGGLWRTDNGGASFVNLNGNLNVWEIYDLAVFPSAPRHVLAGTQDNSSSRRWSEQRWNVSAATGDGFMNLVDPENPALVFQTSYPGSLPSVLRSSTSGAPNSFSWLAQNGLVSGEPYPWVTPMAIVDTPSSSPRVFLASHSVYRAATDQPVDSFTWSKISPALSGTQSVSNLTAGWPNAPAQLWAATADGRVHRTLDALATPVSWSDWTANLPQAYISDVAPDPTNAHRVFVTHGKFGGSKLYVSSSVPASWVGVGNGLPDVPANSVIVDPTRAGRVFVGTDVGVYVSLDNGANFQPFGLGLPLGLVITDLEIDVATRTLVAGSWGRGAWLVTLDEPVIFQDGFESGDTGAWVP